MPSAGRHRRRQLADDRRQRADLAQLVLRLHHRPPGDHQQFGADLDQQHQPHRQLRGQLRRHRPGRGDPRLRHRGHTGGLRRTGSSSPASPCSPGARQNGAAPYREGRISDPAGHACPTSSAATPPPTSPRTSPAISKVASPRSRRRSRAPAACRATAIGTAQVVQQGFDPETGMVWGRWANGVAQSHARQHGRPALPHQHQPALHLRRHAERPGVAAAHRHAAPTR